MTIQDIGRIDIYDGSKLVSSQTVYNAVSSKNKRMTYVPIKCKNCGAPLTRRVNSGMICEYCNTAYKESEI